MASINLAIADAIVTEINANAGSYVIPGVVATMRLRAYRELKDFSTLKVTVVPSVQEREISNRQLILRAYEYSVQVQKRVSPQESLDDYIELSEQIADVFDFWKIRTTEIAVDWRETRIEALFEEDLMEDSHLFSSIALLRLTEYR